MESFLARENITDEPDMEGRTALMWAAGKGAENVIKSIVKHNPDINATDKTGATGELVGLFRVCVHVCMLSNIILISVQ